MNYLKWGSTTLTEPTDLQITDHYDRGFVLTRTGAGAMDQTRSVRIDLSQFELSSENRRILRKNEGVSLMLHALPYSKYSWEIGKLGKDFYDTKFGGGTFSANKIKEILTSDGLSSFNTLLTFTTSVAPPSCIAHGDNPPTDFSSTVKNDNAPVSNSSTSSVSSGYVICYKNDTILHYSYPFYDLETSLKSLGLGMMTKAISWAKHQGLEYVYLGSAQRASDTYKLQFKGLEWFDGTEWSKDVAALKQELSSL